MAAVSNPKGMYWGSDFVLAFTNVQETVAEFSMLAGQTSSCKLSPEHVTSS